MRVFFATESAGGIVLILASAIAILLANSAYASAYFAALHYPISRLTVHEWINDGLMAIFFLLVGLEVKREFVDGHLSSWADRRLPIIAAAAGMIVPAAFYMLAIGGDPSLRGGWAIPAATDIAFAMAVLALLGNRAPTSLKLLLVTIAIVDDIGAVAIIALFYTGGLNMAALAISAAIWAAMMALNRFNVQRLLPYIILSAALWFAVIHSGVHATIAGVLAAFAIPLRRSLAAPDATDSPLHRIEHALAAPVAFVIVPLFGLANAGVALSGITFATVISPLPMGIMLGLFLGKQIGIFFSIWACVHFGIAAKPRDASWQQIYGVALLCGIGFTMSLFIGGLAFSDPVQNDAVKIGVLLGSIASALTGWAVLRFSGAKSA